MRLAKVSEMFELDQKTSTDYGVSPEVLMENAAQAMVDFLIKKRKILDPKSKITVLCGSGHNGGDGFVIARILAQAHFKNVKVIYFESTQTTDLWKKKKSAAEKVVLSIKPIKNIEDYEVDLSNADLVFDALFGVGLNRPLEGIFKQIIEFMNHAKKTVIAVDVPSGLDSDKGISLGAAVRARYTLCCGLAKPGLFLQEGPRYSGRVHVVDIGFPRVLVKEVCKSCFLITKKNATQLLPKRKPTANKSNFGHLLVIAGSEDMPGAAILAATAAARMGCGYVTVCHSSVINKKNFPPDFLALSIDDFYKTDLKKYHAVLVGPGLGLGGSTKKILQHLIGHHSKVLVDADALTICARENLWPLPSDWILTPHAGELAKILSCQAREIEMDRLHFASKAAELTRAKILLKGYRTIVHSQARDFIIGSGNVALAKAGSGDILAGFIASLMAQGLATDHAAVLAAWLHGRIADVWIRSGKGSRTLMASDLPTELGKILAELRQK